MSTETIKKDPLENAILTPEAVRPHAELNPVDEYNQLLMQVQQKLVKRGIYIADLNQLSWFELINILKNVIEKKSLNHHFKEILKCYFGGEGPINPDAIDANSVDWHQFAVEAIEAVRDDKLMHQIIRLIQHAASKGKIADITKDYTVEEEILSELTPVTEEEMPKPFFHVLEEEKAEEHKLVSHSNLKKHSPDPGTKS